MVQTDPTTGEIQPPKQTDKPTEATRSTKAAKPTDTQQSNQERSTEAVGRTAKTGNLTRDPELRFSQSGTAYAKFGLAVETPIKPGDWSGERKVTFYDVTCFDSMAENVAKSLTKGVRVVVIGRAEIERWIDKEGQPRESKVILADSCGPDLRWATCEVLKITRASARSGHDDLYPDEEPF